MRTLRTVRRSSAMMICLPNPRSSHVSYAINHVGTQRDATSCLGLSRQYSQRSSTQLAYTEPPNYPPYPHTPSVIIGFHLGNATPSVVLICPCRSSATHIAFRRRHPVHHLYRPWVSMRHYQSPMLVLGFHLPLYGILTAKDLMGPQ